MAYADYDYYTGTYGGTQLTADAWPASCRRACAYIDLLTLGRLVRGADVTEAVRMAVCAAAEVYGRYAAATATADPGVASESTDGYSVSMADGAARGAAMTAELAQEVGLYLPPSDPLRYRGGYDHA